MYGKNVCWARVRVLLVDVTQPFPGNCSVEKNIVFFFLNLFFWENTVFFWATLKKKVDGLQGIHTHKISILCVGRMGGSTTNQVASLCSENCGDAIAESSGPICNDRLWVSEHVDIYWQSASFHHYWFMIIIFIYVYWRLLFPLFIFIIDSE